MSIEGMSFDVSEPVSFETSNFQSGLADVDWDAPESMITAAFSSIASVFDNAGPAMEVAVTPSQLFNGGLMPATAANAAKIGLKVLAPS